MPPNHDRVLKENNLELTEISSHITGQLVAVHPAYDALFDNFADESVKGNPSARTQWAINKMMNVAKASKNLNLSAAGTFSGALAWPYVYPWPQRPAGLIETAFEELQICLLCGGTPCDWLEYSPELLQEID